MTPLRWGLLSTARINHALIPPLRTSPRNTLTTVASRDAGKAAAYAHEWKIPRVLDSYEALLADPETDVLYIPLPNGLHAEWTIKALHAGKHVLCEKPLAITLEEVDRIAAAARETGRVVMEAFMYRHHPQTLKVKELIDGGAVGALRVIKGSFTFPIASESNVRLDPELGGGSIWDVGCYPISYARLIAEHEPVEAFGWQVTGASSGVDETFTGQLRFPGGVVAQFDCGFRSPFRSHMEIVGTEGVLVVPHPFKPEFNEQIVLTSREGERAIDIPGQMLYLGEVENMADAILQGDPVRVALGDSRGTVAAILALLRSAHEGKPVPVPGA